MLLEISDLHVGYDGDGQPPWMILLGLNLALAGGDAVGVSGDSGCGKTTLARAIVGLLPRSSAVSGSIRFRGRDIARLPEPELRPLRGAKIALISQEPSVSLTPHRRIASQIAEVLAAHRDLPAAAAHREARSILRMYFSTDAERISRSFPHELSGGERQRAAVARALCCGPDLLIADEPTAALDSVMQREILDLFCSLRDRDGLSLLLISHNQRALSRVASRSYVLRGGRLEGS